MFDKDILKKYFGERKLLYIEELSEILHVGDKNNRYVIYYEEYPKDQLGLMTADLGEYDNLIEFVKELGRLIDLRYQDYSEIDRNTLEQVYSDFHNQILKTKYYEMRALMMENVGACVRFRKYFDEGYDRINDTWYWRVGDPCYCYTFSETKSILEREERKREVLLVELGLNDVGIGSDKIKDVKSGEIKIAYIFDNIFRDPAIRQESEESKDFVEAREKYLGELRSKIEISMETFTEALELYQDIFPEAEMTPLEFVDKIQSDTEILDSMLGKHERVPVFLAQVYTLIITQHYE